MLPLTGAGPSAGGLPYGEKVLSYSPIAYWQLNETSGTTAVCSVNAAQNGTLNRDISTMGTGTGIGDGNTAPDFDGGSDVVDIYTTTFRDAFNGAEGTAACWAKVSGVGAWTDGDLRFGIQLYVDDNNQIYILKSSTSNTLTWNYEAGNTVEQISKGSLTETGWMHLALTWTKTSEQVMAYYKGSQEGATATSLGTWSGDPLSSIATCIGAYSVTPGAPWDGYIAHVAMWDSALSGATIAILATV